MDFSDHLADLDASIEDHLCDPALYFAGGDEGVPVRVMIDYPRAADRLNGMSFTRSRPIMQVARARCPALIEGHGFEHQGERWDVAEAPTASDDGHWWVFEVQPG